MNPYEIAMKRLELEALMADQLQLMWIYAEVGEFQYAMAYQLFYLASRDEWDKLRHDETFKSHFDSYWDMWEITTFGCARGQA